MSVSVERIDLRAFHDGDPDLSWLEQFDINDPDPETRKYARLDRIRLQAWRRDKWWCIGMCAEATVTVTDDDTGFSATSRVYSPGLWGVESDSDAAYFIELWTDQWVQLTDDLPLNAIGSNTPVIVTSTPDLPDVL